jgi:hypothetical protein
MTNPFITAFTGDYLEQYQRVYPGGLPSDPEYGAFRHGYASAILTRKLGAGMSEKFGNVFLRY